MKEKIQGEEMFRVGIVGNGGQARIRTQILKQIPGVEIVGICGRSIERAGPLANELGLKAEEDWSHFVEEDFDGVVISTPNYLHAEQIIAALQNGKDVFCEYPLTTNLDDLQKVLTIAESCRKVLYVGFEELFAATQIKERMRSFGNPLLIYHDGLNERVKDFKWYLDESRSGGMIVGWGIAQIATICYLFGRAKSVAAFGSTSFPEAGRSNDIFTICITFANGATGCIQTGVNSPTRFRTLRAIYEKGSVDGWRGEMPTIYEEGEESVRLLLQEPLDYVPTQGIG